MPAASALPGIYFAPPEPRAGSGLPPLDVAAFVGFAERGPLHWPVAVDDLDTFRAIFGGDLAVARDRRGHALHAHLPRCIEAFFANGGRRCYVVRVAGPDARRAGFSLPGLLGLSAGGAIEPPRLAAAWPGSWANGLRVAGRLRTVPLPARQFSLEAGGPLLTWDSGGAPGALEAGDLLRVTLEDSRYLFPIAELRSEPADPSRFWLRGAGFWRLDESAAALPAAVTVRRAGGAEAWDGELGSGDGDGFRLALRLSMPEAATLRRGDILELRAGSGSWLFPVEELRPGVSGSPWRILAAAALSPVPVAPNPSSPPVPRQVERLRFDLLLRLGQEPRMLAGLAFGPGHSRFFGDAVLRESAGLGGRSTASADPAGPRDAAADARLYFKLQPADATRWPRIDPVRDGRPDAALLAGILAPSAAATPGVWFLPLGMAPEPLDYRLPDSAGDDGLDRFDAAAAAWFVEPDLVPDLGALAAGGAPYPGTAGLLADAFERVYRDGLRPRGLHGLLYLDEVALMSAPDAAQGGWPAADGEAGEAPGLPDGEAPPPAAEAFRECAEPLVVDGMTPDFGPVAGGTWVRIRGRGFVPGLTRVHFGGIPAAALTLAGPETLSVLTPPAVRAATVAVTVEVPGAAVAVAGGFRYEPADGATLPLMKDPSEFKLAESPLLPVQRELVRLCLARADATAILGLPVHFEKRQCFDWLERLRPLLGWPSRGEWADELGAAADLSYAAVYHPWLLQRTASGSAGFVATPPDGAVLGMIAATEQRRQAWGAPANIPLREPLGLSPELSAADAADLLARCFNLVRAEPRGFPVATARTLSADRNLAQLSVRRLLILLRKTLLLLGAELVFQGNSARLRSRLRFELENLLRGFFDRGALAGGAYGEAFRVEVFDEGAEAGQLRAEIRIAPSRPVEFITVRLVRTGEGVLRIGED